MALIAPGGATICPPSLMIANSRWSVRRWLGQFRRAAARSARHSAVAAASWAGLQICAVAACAAGVVDLAARADQRGVRGVGAADAAEVRLRTAPDHSDGYTDEHDHNGEADHKGPSKKPARRPDVGRRIILSPGISGQGHVKAKVRPTFLP